MDNQLPPRASSAALSLGAAVRHPLIAAVFAGLLLFAAVCYLPSHALSVISWHLYLDRLHPLFAIPVGWNGRMAMGGGIGIAAFLITLFIGLILPRRAEPQIGLEPWAFERADASVSDESIAESPPFNSVPFLIDEDELPVRNKQDSHPDDAPRPPLSAERDLPAGGLYSADPAPVFVSKSGAVNAPPKPNEPILLLADLAHEPALAAGKEPWFEAVEHSGPAKPLASDLSLSAMVERLEAGFLRRRRSAPMAEALAVPMPEPAPQIVPMRVEDHKVDVALEAALSTLHRMNLRAAAG